MEAFFSPQRRATADGAVSEDEDALPRTTGKKRKASRVEAPKDIVHKGSTLTVHPGRDDLEDERWIYVLERNPNGTAKYICVGCSGTWTSKSDRIWVHFLRLGKLVKKCNWNDIPSQCLEVCRRHEIASTQLKIVHRIRCKAVGRTPNQYRQRFRPDRRPSGHC